MAIFKALVATYYKEFLFAFLFNFIYVVIQISMPFLIIRIIDFMSTPSGEDGGILYGIGIVSAYIFVSCSTFLLDEHAIFLQTLLGVQAYGGLVTLIYDKILKITPSTNKDFEQGQIINFIQVDAERAFDVAWSFPPVARLPIQLIFGLGFLFYYFGLYLLPALGVVAVLTILNFFFSLWIASIQDEVLKRKDKRMNTTTEVVNNIKIIKLNSWVEYFIEKVSKLRVKELAMIRKQLWVNCFEIITSFMTSPAFMVVTFSFYFYFGNSMILSNAFAARHIFWTIDGPIRWIPQFIGNFTEFLVSMKRIQKFLLWDEINPKIVSINEEWRTKHIDILIENANFTWAGNNNKTEEKSKTKEEKGKSSKSNFKTNKNSG